MEQGTSTRALLKQLLEMLYQHTDLIRKIGGLFHQEIYVTLIQLLGRGQISNVQCGTERVQEVKDLNQKLTCLV